MSIISVVDVEKKYLLGKQVVIALDGVSVEIEEGEFTAIAGPSGSGKSTLLNLIGCIDTPDKGKIIIKGTDVSTQTPDQLADYRARTVGFIFQTFNLLPVLTAQENVEYALLYRKDVSKSERQKRVAHFLDLVGLTKYVNHRPNELSGGQRQRVAIARALVTNPSIVLADEPTANLDHKTGNSILALMKEINQDLRANFIFSTHDASVIAIADRVVNMLDGKLASQ